jgi:hypothetical protein
MLLEQQTQLTQYLTSSAHVARKSSPNAPWGTPPPRKKRMSKHQPMQSTPLRQYALRVSILARGPRRQAGFATLLPLHAAQTSKYIIMSGTQGKGDRLNSAARCKRCTAPPSNGEQQGLRHPGGSRASDNAVISCLRGCAALPPCRQASTELSVTERLLQPSISSVLVVLLLSGSLPHRDLESPPPSAILTPRAASLQQCDPGPEHQVRGPAIASLLRLVAGISPGESGAGPARSSNTSSATCQMAADQSNPLRTSPHPCT